MREAAEETAEDSRIILFASKTCPNCKAAALLLDRAGVNYEKVYAEDDREADGAVRSEESPDAGGYRGRKRYENTEIYPKSEHI